MCGREHRSTFCTERTSTVQAAHEPAELEELSSEVPALGARACATLGAEVARARERSGELGVELLVIPAENWSARDLAVVDANHPQHAVALLVRVDRAH